MPAKSPTHIETTNLVSGRKTASPKTNIHPKRVLFVAHSANRGGAEYCLDTTLKHLNREQFEPLVVFPFEGPMVDSVRRMGIEALVMPMCHWLYFKKDLWYWKNLFGRSYFNIRRLTKLIRDQRIDLVYTNTSAIFEAALAARRAAVPHLWHVHEVLMPGNDMSQLLPVVWMQRLIKRYSNQVVFESNSARAAFEATTPLSKVEVVYNSLRLEASMSDVNQHRSEFGVPEGTKSIVFVGQFIDRKNPCLLIEAVARIAAENPVRCLLVGHGVLEDEMRGLIAKLGIDHLCKIVPFQDNIAKVMSAADVVVLPSKQESFGLVLVEAGAFGKPVIACNCQGPNEIIVDGETGLLVEQDDVDSLVRAITRLVQSPELACEMGMAGRQRVAELFSPTSNTLRIESLMERLCATRNAV